RGLALRIAGDRGEFVLVVGEGNAARAVEQHAVEREAEPAGESTERVDLGAAVRRDPDDAGDACGVAGKISPTGVGLDAEDPGAGLVVGADLAAGEAAADVNIGSGRTEERSAEPEGGE